MSTFSVPTKVSFERSRISMTSPSTLRPLRLAVRDIFTLSPCMACPDFRSAMKIGSLPSSGTKEFFPLLFRWKVPVRMMPWLFSLRCPFSITCRKSSSAISFRMSTQSIFSGWVVRFSPRNICLRAKSSPGRICIQVISCSASSLFLMCLPAFFSFFLVIVMVVLCFLLQRKQFFLNNGGWRGVFLILRRRFVFIVLSSVRF